MSKAVYAERLSWRYLGTPSVEQGHLCPSSHGDQLAFAFCGLRCHKGDMIPLLLQIRSAYLFAPL